MSWLNIELALQKRVNSIGLTNPIFYENVKEDATVDEHFVVKNFPTITMANDKNYSDTRYGYYQISIFELTDTGKKNILDLTDLILSYFRFGDELTEGDDVVFIEDATPTPLDTQSKYAVVHITINYNSYQQR